MHLTNSCSKFRLFIVPGGPVRPRSVAGIAMEMFEQHQGTHILQVHCLYMMQQSLRWNATPHTTPCHVIYSTNDHINTWFVTYSAWDGVAVR